MSTSVLLARCSLNFQYDVAWTKFLFITFADIFVFDALRVK